MANTIKGAVVMKNHQYFGGNSTLKKVAFLRDSMFDIAHGWIRPYTDNGLGGSTYGTDFVMEIIQEPGAVRATRFLYTQPNAQQDEVYLSCDSGAFEAAYTNIDPQNFTDLNVATGSGYNTVG